MTVSCATPPEPAASLESFFDRLETSSDGGDATRRPLLLVNALHPIRAAGGGGWASAREDLGGLALGCVMVIALVAATAWFLAG